MPLQDDAPEQHVPAWKKLGLKLKYAQEKSDSITTNHPDTVNEKKRKRSSDKDASPPAESVKNLKTKKKKRTKVEALGSTADTSNPDTFQPSPEDLTVPPDQETPSRPGGTPKSVSFTPDTKKTDGDSVKQLYQTWLYSHLAKDPSFDPSTYNPALQVITPHTISSTKSLTQPTATKKTKKQKGSKRSKASQESNSQRADEFSSSPHQATLDYLHTYHTSPSLWKFSKSRQTHLLRHLFSPGFIPPSHDLALTAYLSSLQGEGAKTRLRIAARKIQAEDLESQDLDEAGGAHSAKEDSAQEKQSHTDRVERDLKTKDEEKEEKDVDLNKTLPPTRRQMADLVLLTIGNEEEAESKPNTKPETKKAGINDGEKKKTTTTNGTTTHPHKKRKRKNKVRTTMTSYDDDDESSSSSSRST